MKINFGNLYKIGLQHLNLFCHYNYCYNTCDTLQSFSSNISLVHVSMVHHTAPYKTIFSEQDLVEIMKEETSKFILKMCQISKVGFSYFFVYFWGSPIMPSADLEMYPSFTTHMKPFGH